MFRRISFGGSGNRPCVSECMNQPKKITLSSSMAWSLVSTKMLFSTTLPPPNWMNRLLAPERAMTLPYTVTPLMDASR